jgi:hypothetical protein
MSYYEINEGGCPWDRGFRDPCTDDGEYPQDDYECEEWDTRDEYEMAREDMIEGKKG